MKNGKLMICFLLLLGCNRKFDIPPPETVVELHADKTIRQLKEKHVSGRFERIEENTMIEGVVIANDRTGNFYQSLIIQDESGGIVLRLSGNNLYASYPIGRKVYVKLHGLYMGDYGGTIQLGGGVDSSLVYRPQLASLASALIDDFVLKGAFNQNVTPRTIHADQLTDNLYDTLQSTLVTLEHFQFQDADLGQTLADTSRQNSAVSFILQSCNGESIILRNSSYASFAGVPVSGKNGALTGIFSIYNADKQMAIRDTSDLAFDQDRCAQQVADTNKITTIRHVRSLYTGRSVVIPFGTVIRGQIISDSKNEAYGNYKIQDESGVGIILYGTALPVLELNKIYLMDIGGTTLELFSNELEITRLAATKIFPSSSAVIVPRTTNIAQIRDSLETFASTLLRLNNVYISAPTVTSGGRTYTIMDNSGSMETFIRSAAGFSLQPGNAQSLSGYLSLYQGAGQLVLRTPDDVIYEGSQPVEPISFAAEYTFRNVTTSSGRVDPGPFPSVYGLYFGAFHAVGLGSNPSASARFSFTGWPLGATSNGNDFTGVMDENKYYEVTITPDYGARLSLDAIEWVIQRSATGPRQWCVRSSLDHFTQNIAAVSTGANIRVTNESVFQIADRSVSTATAGCRLELGETVRQLESAITFRFYAFNAESSQGSFSLNSVRLDGKVE